MLLWFNFILFYFLVSIDIVLELLELVETVIMQHQRFIHILLLVEEEQAEASSKQLLGLLFEIVSSVLFVGIVYYLYEFLTDSLWLFVHLILRLIALLLLTVQSFAHTDE